MGISMGGYGACCWPRNDPDLISAVAAISPAIWTSYAEARAANAGAYASAADFAADDAVTHAAGAGPRPGPRRRRLRRPVLPRRPGPGPRPAEGPGRARSLAFGDGCHTGPFFTAQEPPSLAFLARHLTPQV